jgi:hypothetical protein
MDVEPLVGRPAEAADEAVREERVDVGTLCLDSLLPRGGLGEVELELGRLVLGHEGLAVGHPAAADRERDAERRRQAQRHAHRLRGEVGDPPAGVAAVRRRLGTAEELVDQ